MSSEAIIFVQTLSLVFCLASIVGVIYLVRRKEIRLGMIALPLLVVINLAAFLGERVLVKVFGVEFNVAPGFINSWAILIQFHLALSAVTMVYIWIVNSRKNGRH